MNTCIYFDNFTEMLAKITIPFTIFQAHVVFVTPSNFKIHRSPGEGLLNECIEAILTGSGFLWCYFNVIVGLCLQCTSIWHETIKRKKSTEIRENTFNRAESVEFRTDRQRI